MLEHTPFVAPESEIAVKAIEILFLCLTYTVYSRAARTSITIIGTSILAQSGKARSTAGGIVT